MKIRVCLSISNCFSSLRHIVSETKNVYNILKLKTCKICAVIRKHASFMIINYLLCKIVEWVVKFTLCYP